MTVVSKITGGFEERPNLKISDVSCKPGMLLFLENHQPKFAAGHSNRTNSMDEINHNQSAQPDDLRIFQARWILPVSRPPLANGGIAVRGGQIVQVDSIESLRADYSAPITELGEAVIFPAFINVHTHLDHARPPRPPGSVLDYVTSKQQLRPREQAAERSAIIRDNISASERAGVIAMADFSNDGLSCQLLGESSLYARVFIELRGFREANAPYIIRQGLRDIQQLPATKKITCHLAPATIWQVSPALFREISIQERHIAIHLGMTCAEREFILSGQGRLRQFLHAYSDFEPTWEAPGVSPVDYFFTNHFFARHNILIHVVDVTSADVEIIKNAPAKANICLCPRANRTLAMGRAPLNILAENGLNICLGTESLLAVEDFDLRKEMQACIQEYGCTPDQVLKYATLNGAYAIGFHKEVGSLDPGKSARCLVIQNPSMPVNDPYEMVLNPDLGVSWLV